MNTQDVNQVVNVKNVTQFSKGYSDTIAKTFFIRIH